MLNVHVRKRVYILIYTYMRLSRIIFVDESLDLFHHGTTKPTISWPPRCA
jgi:hypothetical protein